MRKTLLLSAFGLSLSWGCKTPSQGTAQVKDIQSVQKLTMVQSTDQAGKPIAVINCAPGWTDKTSHTAELAVPWDQVSNLSYDQMERIYCTIRTADANGGNPTALGGGGGGGAVEPPPGASPFQDLTSCGNLPEQYKHLNISLAADVQAKLGQLSVAVAKQQVCVGFVNSLNLTMAASATLAASLAGQGLSGPILIVVGLDGTPVTFDKGTLILNVPLRFTDVTSSQIFAALGAGNVAVCPGTAAVSARFVANACWFLGVQGASCAQTCAALGKTYASATNTFGGTAGSNDACTSLCAGWGVGKFAEKTPTGQYDCYLEVVGAAYECRRDKDADGDSANSASAAFARICSCQ